VEKVTDIAVVMPFQGEWSRVIPSLEAISAQTVRQRITLILSIDGEQEPPPEVKNLVDVFVNGEHRGPASARNRGWRVSSAPVVLFTDSDCIPEPSWAEALAAGLEGEFQAVKGVYSSGGTRLIQRLAQVEFEERYRLMSRAAVVYLADTYSAGFRRSWLEKLGGFDESFPLPEHEDVDLSWRLTEAGGKIGFVPGARVAHAHRATWKDYFRLKYRRGKWRIILVRKFPARVLTDGYTPQTMKLQMLLSVPVVLSVLLLPVFPVVTAVAAALFLILSVPLAVAAYSTDRGTLPFIPLFALWRGVALSAGAVDGLSEGASRCLLP
jgi:GT2 family glycosyltransferase